jgi:hypothetical protein
MMMYKNPNFDYYIEKVVISYLYTNGRSRWVSLVPIVLQAVLLSIFRIVIIKICVEVATALEYGQHQYFYFKTIRLYQTQFNPHPSSSPKAPLFNDKPTARFTVPSVTILR